MKISKTTDNEITFTFPMYQKSNNAYDIRETDVPNLLGVITHEKGFIDYTLNQSIDMSYCGKSPQTGMPILHLDEETWKKVVKDFNLDTVEYPECPCGETIYGSYTYKDGKPCCFNCESKV